MAVLNADHDPMVWLALEPMELPNGDTWLPLVKRQYLVSVETPHGRADIQVELSDVVLPGMHLARPVLAHQALLFSDRMVHDHKLREIAPNMG